MAEQNIFSALNLNGNSIIGGGFEVVASLPPAADNFVGRQIVFKGVPHFWNGEEWVSNTAIQEAFLEWGGKNLNNASSPIDSVMLTGHNVLEFLDAARVTVEYSTDNGANWVNLNPAATKKITLFSAGINEDGNEFFIGNTSALTNALNNRLRITISGGNNLSGIPCARLRKLYIRISDNNALLNAGHCAVRAKRATDSTWTKVVADDVIVSGYPGWNTIQLEDIRIGGTAGAGYDTAFQSWQFEFWVTASPTGVIENTLSVRKILMIADTVYFTSGNTNPAELRIRQTGHLYDYDASKNATFPAKVTATSLAVKKGTSSQFLKGNGSLDPSVYIKQDGSNGTSAGVSTLLGKLETTSSAISDDTVLIVNLDGNAFLQEKAIDLWEFIKAKGNETYAFGDGNGAAKKLAENLTFRTYQSTSQYADVVFNGDEQKQINIWQGANINGKLVVFSNSSNLIPAYLPHEGDNYLYPIRFNFARNVLQYSPSSGTWVDAIKSCNCRETRIIDDLNAITDECVNYELSDQLTNELLLGKVLFPQSISLDKVVLNFHPFVSKSFNVDSIKNAFNDFIKASEAKFFIENDLSAMLSSGSNVFAKITVIQKPIPKIVVECYVEY